MHHISVKQYHYLVRRHGFTWKQFNLHCSF